MVYEYDSFGRSEEVRTVREISSTEHIWTKTEYDYNDTTSLALESETITIDPDGNGAINSLTRVIDRSVDQYLQDTGFELSDGSNPAEADVDYAYDSDDGRVETVSGAHAGSTRTFTYGFATNSMTLINTISGPAHLVENSWETSRDVLDVKENSVGGYDVSQYDYTVNAIGQRTNVAKSGSEFGSTPGFVWRYDSKGQLVYQDETTTTDQDRGFWFDDIGNRERSSVNTSDAGTASGANLAVYRSGASGSSPEGGNELNQYLRQ